VSAKRGRECVRARFACSASWSLRATWSGECDRFIATGVAGSLADDSDCMFMLVNSRRHGATRHARPRRSEACVPLDQPAAGVLVESALFALSQCFDRRASRINSCARDSRAWVPIIEQTSGDFAAI